MTAGATLFEAIGDGTIALVGGYSPSSGHHHFPLADLCPYTGADDVERVLLPTTGRLWLWTSVTSAPPGYDGPVPYGLGIVILDETDLRVAGRLTVADPAALAEGDPMRLVADLEVWAWEPS
jgi:uncharacterized OB-fold protein